MRAHPLQIANTAVKSPGEPMLWIRGVAVRRVMTCLAVWPLLTFTQPTRADDRAKSPPAETQPLLNLDKSELERAKQNARGGHAAMLPALKKLQIGAERAQLGDTYSVTDKTLSPPSGNKHDYMSLAPYWWPNPNTANGLPTTSAATESLIRNATGRQIESGSTAWFTASPLWPPLTSSPTAKSLLSEPPNCCAFGFWIMAPG